MYKEKCRMCGEEFEAELVGRERHKLNRHVKNKHKISIEEYLLDGKPHPLCACGCGNKVGYSKWVFNKYYKDHKNLVPQTDEVKSKIRKGLKDRYSKLVSKGKVNVEEIKVLWERYKVEKDLSLDVISKITGFDKRTICGYWWKFGISSKEEVKRYARIHKHVFANQGEKNGTFLKIEDEVLEKMFDYISDNKNSYTLNDIKEKFNLPFKTSLIYKRLCEKFGKDVVRNFMKLNRGMSSVEEVTFGSVLMFYFGEKHVQPQFVIKFYDEDKKRKNRKYYDYCLFDKLLIEYDGKYWHNSLDILKNDQFKEDLAVKNGFMFLRIDSKEAKSFDILSKIKEIIDEIQVSANKKG